MTTPTPVDREMSQRLDQFGRLEMWNVKSRKKQVYWAVDAKAALAHGIVVLDESDLPPLEPEVKPDPASVEKSAAKTVTKPAAIAAPKTEV